MTEAQETDQARRNQRIAGTAFDYVTIIQTKGPCSKTVTIEADGTLRGEGQQEHRQRARRIRITCRPPTTWLMSYGRYRIATISCALVAAQRSREFHRIAKVTNHVRRLAARTRR